MVNRSLLAAKWTELAERLGQVRKHRKMTLAELESGRDATELVAFNLMPAVQVCADVANHLIADQGWPAPRTTGEAFTRLAEHGVIAPELAAGLKLAVGFRNVIVHGYAGVELRPLHRASMAGVDDLDAFARAVARWANVWHAGQLRNADH
jgi:uncharacterized protein YutE (UPF0331/DUF86 family)